MKRSQGSYGKQITKGSLLDNSCQYGELITEMRYYRRRLSVETLPNRTKHWWYIERLSRPSVAKSQPTHTQKH